MRRSIVAVAVSAAFVLTSGLVFAQRGQGGPKGPKTTKVTQTTPKAHAGGPQGPKAKSPAATTKTHGPKASTTPKSHGKPTTTVDAAKTKTKGPDRAGTTPTTPAGTTLTLSPVQQKLQQNTNLASKLQGRLGGADVIAAAEGFRNLGQFVAAVNVSNNLGISFAELKRRMVDGEMSLGQAIKAERNDVDITTEVQRAERDARIVIADAEEEMQKKDTKAPKPRKSGGR